MALQLRRGTEANLPAPSDALVGEPLFTTDTGQLWIKKADGTLVQIGSGGSGTGGGAPTNADYLVRTANGSLSAERVVGDSTSVAANWNTSGAVTFERAALTGDVTAAANSNATTIAAGAVTGAKIAASAVTTDKLASSVYAGTGSASTVSRSDHGHSLSALSGTILLGAAGTAQLPTPADASQTATIQWVPGTGWTIVQSTSPPGPTYDPAVDYLPQAYGAAWPPSSGPYVQGVEVGDTYTGTVTLSPTTGTTGITFAIDGTPTGSLTVTASQAAPAVSAPSGFSLATTASRRRTVTVTATNGSANKVDTTTVDFGWRLVMFSLPSTTTVTDSTLQTAMQSSGSDHRVRFQPNATANNDGVTASNLYTFTVPTGSSVNRIYLAHTVSGATDSYGWTPVFTEPFFGNAVSTWTLVGTFTADPGDGVAKSYRVWRQSSLWGPGDVMTQGVR